GSPRVAQARLRVGPRGRVAARASDPHGSLGHRARRDRGEPHRFGRRTALAGRPGRDVLALLGAVTGAGYYVIGRYVRQTVEIWRYATGVYAVAAAALALLALARSMP